MLIAADGRRVAPRERNLIIEARPHDLAMQGAVRVPPRGQGRIPIRINAVLREGDAVERWARRLVRRPPGGLGLGRGVILPATRRRAFEYCGEYLGARPSNGWRTGGMWMVAEERQRLCFTFLLPERA